MSPTVAFVRAVIARVVQALRALDDHLAAQITRPATQRLKVVVIASFVLFQAGNAFFQSLLPAEMRSGFGFRIPWQMFTYPKPYTLTLKAVGTTARGEKITIPIHDEIFTHYRGLSRVRAFEEALWLMTPPPGGSNERKQLFAEYLRDRMAAWGVEIVQVQFFIKATPDDPKIETEYGDLGTFATPTKGAMKEPE